MDALNEILSNFKNTPDKCIHFHVIVHRKVFKEFHKMFHLITNKRQTYRCSCFYGYEHAHLIVRSADDFRDTDCKYISWGVRIELIKNKNELIDVQLNAIKYFIMRKLTENLNCPYKISFEDYRRAQFEETTSNNAE